MDRSPTLLIIVKKIAGALENVYFRSNSTRPGWKKARKKACEWGRDL